MLSKLMSRLPLYPARTMVFIALIAMKKEAIYQKKSQIGAKTIVSRIVKMK